MNAMKDQGIFIDQCNSINETCKYKKKKVINEVCK